jgi:hypothetical protein
MTAEPAADEEPGMGGTVAMERRQGKRRRHEAQGWARPASATQWHFLHCDRPGEFPEASVYGMIALGFQ